MRSRIPGPTCAERGTGIMQNSPECVGQTVSVPLEILNGDISLGQFNSIYMYNRRQPKDYFRRSLATRRELLPAGTLLWKCTDYQLRAGFVTEWWAPGDHLKPALEHCMNLGVSLQRYCRVRYAVIWEWGNKASHLLKARLLEPVYAFAGQTKPMGTKHTPGGQDTGMGNLALIGGDPQLCIPNLTLAEITQVSFE